MEENEEFTHGEFLLNKRTLEIHHLPFETENCQIAEIKLPVVSTSLKALREIPGSDLCKLCFASKR